ncbi:MAG: RagB/SusD family nutrient uptake outer membrane protein, partial [Bacteroidia bacterium]|nr:RagB/SusD family nutrient uptake outer membrane protein [Bacteroidia bacterium]
MKNSYKIIFLLFVTLLMGACSKDDLTLAPETSLGELNAFDTKERVVGQVNGLYASVKSGAFLGGRYYVYNDIREENFIPKSSNLVTNYATWNHTVIGSTNEVQNLWGAIYASINAINLFLTGLDENYNSGKLATIGVTDAEYNQYKGEALALRGICYFSMLQLYAQPYNKDNGASPGLPLRLIAEKTAANNDLARSSVAETYAQILSDLNAAEPLLLANNGSTLLNVTRLHKNSVVAYKTRVYLHMNNFGTVKSEAAKIVSATAPFQAASGVGFRLNSTFAGIWASPYTTTESILSMPFTSTNLPGTQNGLAHYHHPSSSESYYLK